MNTSRQTWKRLLGFVYPDRRFLIGGLICAACVSGSSLLAVSLIRNLLKSMERSDQSGLTFVCCSLVGIYAVRWFLIYGETVFFAESGFRLSLRLRNAIFAHLQGLSLRFFNRQRTGALMSTMNNDVPVLQNTIASLKDVATAPFLIIGGGVYIFLINWKLALVAMLVFPVMASTINRISRIIRQITSQTQDKLADVNTLMEESISGVRVIQSFSAEQHEIRRFMAENQLAKDLALWSVKRAAQLKPSIDFIGALGIAFALWFGGYLIIHRQLSVPDLLTFVGMLNQIAVGINGLGSAKITYEQVQAAGGRILENVLNVESDVREMPNAIVLPAVAGKVEFRDVLFAYNAHTPVLRDLNFTMNPGEVVAVVGPSGAGKSTIADLIPRFYDPDLGQVLIDGHDLRSVTLGSLRSQIGIVPQETVLFGGTIRENIAYGNPQATDAMIEAAARAANAQEFITDPKLLPDGYQTIVGERGKQLSGGQRQRIAIARALLKDPRILILDEATSSLDAKSEILVQEALELLMQGRTTLVIAHRLSTIRNADTILFLNAGQIVEAGTHDELIQRRGLYAQHYESQLRSGGEAKSAAPAVAAAS